MTHGHSWHSSISESSPPTSEVPDSSPILKSYSSSGLRASSPVTPNKPRVLPSVASPPLTSAAPTSSPILRSSSPILKSSSLIPKNNSLILKSSSPIPKGSSPISRGSSSTAEALPLLTTGNKHSSHKWTYQYALLENDGPEDGEDFPMKKSKTLLTTFTSDRSTDTTIYFTECMLELSHISHWTLAARMEYQCLRAEELGLITSIMRDELEESQMGVSDRKQRETIWQEGVLLAMHYYVFLGLLPVTHLKMVRKLLVLNMILETSWTENHEKLEDDGITQECIAQACAVTDHVTEATDGVMYLVFEELANIQGKLVIATEGCLPDFGINPNTMTDEAIQQRVGILVDSTNLEEYFLNSWDLERGKALVFSSPPFLRLHHEFWFGHQSPFLNPRLTGTAHALEGRLSGSRNVLQFTTEEFCPVALEIQEAMKKYKTEPELNNDEFMPIKLYRRTEDHPVAPLSISSSQSIPLLTFEYPGNTVSSSSSSLSVTSWYPGHAEVAHDPPPHAEPAAMLPSPYTPCHAGDSQGDFHSSDSQGFYSSDLQGAFNRYHAEMPQPQPPYYPPPSSQQPDLAGESHNDFIMDQFYFQGSSAGWGASNAVSSSTKFSTLEHLTRIIAAMQNDEKKDSERKKAEADRVGGKVIRAQVTHNTCKRKLDNVDVHSDNSCNKENISPYDHVPEQLSPPGVPSTKCICCKKTGAEWQTVLDVIKYVINDEELEDEDERDREDDEGEEEMFDNLSF
ncbi:hypothetical protein DFH29DRAFT_880050 [Suillus ampliporus]|nr:hypothetical protein DFH29DRAFT_880050 [Suillus ampliporus]